MKNVLYVILLIVGLVLDYMSMNALKSFFGIALYAIGIAIFLGLLVWQLLALKKASDDLKKRKIRRRIAFIVYIPFLILIIWLIYIVVGYSIMF